MSICLNMIVKNEAKIIRRCLSSVLPYIDSWVIVDTGSTDGTETIVKSCLQRVPGFLYERPWIDFGSNRNEALSLAQDFGDYFLFIDADDELLGDTSVLKKPLDKDYYAVHYQKGICQTKRVLLASSKLSWK